MFFKKRYSVCRECGVHFEPASKGERDAGFGDLCLTHRRPWIERAQRREEVLVWAGANWEKLEKQMEEQQAAEVAAMSEYATYARQLAMNMQFGQQSGNSFQMPTGGIWNLFG